MIHNLPRTILSSLLFISIGCNGCQSFSPPTPKNQESVFGGIPNIGVATDPVVNEMVKRGVVVTTSGGKGCSGFVIETGKVVTAAHCFPASTTETIMVDDQPATIAGISLGVVEKDYMVLSASTAEFPRLQMAEPYLDQEVILVANQHNLKSTVWRGRIVHIQEKWISTDIQVVPGASGSPLVTTDGKLLGILTRGNAAITQIVRANKLENV